MELLAELQENVIFTSEVKQPWNFRKNRQLKFEDAKRKQEKEAKKTEATDKTETIKLEYGTEHIARDSNDDNTEKRNIDLPKLSGSIAETKMMDHNIAPIPDRNVVDSAMPSGPDSPKMATVNEENDFRKSEDPQSNTLKRIITVASKSRSLYLKPKSTDLSTSLLPENKVGDETTGIPAKIPKPGAGEGLKGEGIKPKPLKAVKTEDQKAIHALMKVFNDMKKDCEAGIDELESEVKEMIGLVSISLTLGISAAQLMAISLR